MENEFTELAADEFVCTVTEEHEVGTVVAVDSRKLEKIRGRDQEPQFVTVKIESGRSKSNRVWSGEILARIAEQVNKKEPVGYLGHISEKDDATAFPIPQTLWLGATTTRDTGKTVIFVKGYNFPKAEVRDLVDLGAVNSVSVRGNSRMRATREGYEVVDFELESIDWARKGREGMRAPVVAITSEMVGSENEEGGTTVEPKDIAALQEAELRQHNPTLVGVIERAATEKANENVAEMEEKVEGAEENQNLIDKIREKLGIEESDDPIESLATLFEQVEEAAKGKAREFVDALLERKIPNVRARAVVAKLVGEMETPTLEDGDISADDQKKIEAKVNETLDGEEVKELVSEMGGFADLGTDGEGNSQKAGGLHLRQAPVDRTGSTKEDEFVRRSKVTIR